MTTDFKYVCENSDEQIMGMESVLPKLIEGRKWNLKIQFQKKAINNEAIPKGSWNIVSTGEMAEIIANINIPFILKNQMN